MAKAVHLDEPCHKNQWLQTTRDYVNQETLHLRHCLLEHLPNELLTRVLSEMDQTSRSKCAQLSRRWQQLAMQPRLWRRLRINDGPGIDVELMRRLSVWLSGSLLELDFRFKAQNLAGASLLTSLLTNARNLQHLAVHWLRSSPGEYNPLSFLGSCCPHLRTLRLLLCFSDAVATAGALAQLQAGCPDLSHMEIVVSHVSLEPQIASTFASLIGRLKSLSLGLNFPYWSIFPKLSVCAELRSLALCNIRESDLLPLLPRLPGLSELTLRFGAVTDVFIRSLADVCRDLRSLRLQGGLASGLTSDSLLMLLEGCQKLRCLDVLDYLKLHSADYRRVVSSLPAGLAELRLQCTELTEEDLKVQLPGGLRRLELRLLSSSSRDSVRGLRAGVAGCAELTHLNLTDCHDELLPALLSKLPRLHCLRFTDCRNLSRLAWTNLRALTGSSPDLHELQALQCPESSLTDEAVADLCSSPVARGLRRLRLQPCHQLTGASLASIAGACPWLTGLWLPGCRQLAPADRALIASGFDCEVDFYQSISLLPWPDIS